jgi:hypothetical protein
MAQQDKLVQLSQMLDSLTEDTSIPKNIRLKITTAKAKMLENIDDSALKISNSAYALEDVSHDINLPMHARSIIWTILSELEQIKEKLR